MEGRAKFDKELYDKHNGLAIKVSADFLHQFGFETKISDQEAYCSHDFLAVKNNFINKIEVEQKVGWKNNKGWEGFKTVDVPYRKRRSGSDWFIMINNNSKALMICPMKLIQNSATSCKDTIYSKNERFFNVDPKNCDFYVLEDEWICVSERKYYF